MRLSPNNDWLKGRALGPELLDDVLAMEFQGAWTNVRLGDVTSLKSHHNGPESHRFWLNIRHGRDVEVEESDGKEVLRRIGSINTRRMIDPNGKAPDPWLFGLDNLNVCIVGVVESAIEVGLITGVEAFQLGLSLRDQDNWEDGEDIVDHIRNLAYDKRMEEKNYSEYSDPKRKGLYEAIDLYDQDAHERKEDSAAAANEDVD